MKFIYIAIISFMFFSSSIFMTEDWGTLGILSVYLSIISIIFISILMFKKIELSYNKTLLILVYLFCLINCLSAWNNSDINLLGSALIFLLMFTVTTIVLTSYFKEDIIKVVIISIIISHIPIILFPILIDGIEQPYLGIFYNANSLGGVAITIFTVFLSLFFGEFEKIIYSKSGSKFKIAMYFMMCLLLFVLMLFSNSRTSFLAGIVLIISATFLISIYSIKYKKMSKFVLKLFYIAPMIAIVYWAINFIIPINHYINENIISKFVRKEADILDMRGDIWLVTFKEAGLFGNGNNYFTETFGLGAHNTFMSILGQYGWISLIIFTLIILLSTYYCLIYSLNVSNQYKYLPFLMLITFIVTSMGEIMLYKLSMLASFCLLGTAANNSKLIIKFR